MMRKKWAVIGLALGLSVPVAFVAHPASAATSDAIAQALVTATLQNLGLDDLSPDLSKALAGQLTGAIDAGVIDPAISSQVASLLENPAMLGGLADVFDDHLGQESNSWSQSPLSEQVVEDDGTVADDEAQGEPDAPAVGVGNLPARTGDPLENTEDSGNSGDVEEPETSVGSGSSGRGDGGRGDGGRGNGGRGDGGRGDGGRGNGNGNDDDENDGNGRFSDDSFDMNWYEDTYSSMH
jgi:hypothetical protein